MADYNKERFFWLKLKRDFFKRHDVRIIEAMPNGKDYVLFYLKLMVESIDHDGELRFSDSIPYTEQMLATVTDTNVDVVRSAIKIFESLGIVEIWEDKTLYLKEVKGLVGSQTAGAERRQIQRLNQAEKLEGRQKGDICHPEKELELESLLKILKNKESIAEVCARVRDNETFATACDEVLSALAFAGESERDWTFGERTVSSDEFARLATKPHGFDGNMLCEAVNALILQKSESIVDRRFYILGIIVNRFMR